MLQAHCKNQHTVHHVAFVQYFAFTRFCGLLFMWPLFYSISNLCYWFSFISFILYLVLTDIDISACDSGLDQDTPPSTHRPSSYREPYYMMHSARDSTDTGVSSSRGTLVSPKGSFRTNHENGNAALR